MEKSRQVRRREERWSSEVDRYRWCGVEEDNKKKGHAQASCSCRLRERRKK